MILPLKLSASIIIKKLFIVTLVSEGLISIIFIDFINLHDIGFNGTRDRFNLSKKNTTIFLYLRLSVRGFQLYI